MNIWRTLSRPFFVLAPMDDVTDVVFRQVIAECAAPNLFFTEFASVDGFQSAGQSAVWKKLMRRPEEDRLIAQLWGLVPAHFEKTAKELSGLGFAGIDLNMGCPVRHVIKIGACSALMANRPLAHEIIEATRKGAGALPLSIKTRIGQKDYDESWLAFLLEHKPAALTVHFRSVQELSKTEAHWELAHRLVTLRNELSPETILVGNGDVLSYSQGEATAQATGLDGIMIGRGVFNDPFVFAKNSPWQTYTKDQRLLLFNRHIELFKHTWADTKNPAVLKKFAKVYVSDFDGAKELREQLMATKSIDELQQVLK